MPVLTENDPIAVVAAVLPELQWQRLSLLRGQMEANCNALESRDPALADQLRSFEPETEFVLALRGTQVIIARLEGTAARVRPCLLSAEAAQQTIARLCPSGACTESLLIAGVDQGWLWDQAYTLPSAVPALPGHRPPLYFLVRDIEELWLALHLHDWRLMLADPRVRLSVGEDAVAQFERGLRASPQIPVPRVALSIGPQLWAPGTDLASVVAASRMPLEVELQNLMARYGELYAWATPGAIAEKIRSGQKLRVLGITSRYTTFLQYSMRDWLSAMGRLGHETKLVIEGDAHESHTTLCFARACVEFLPDVVVMVDHYRGEFGTLPRQIPCVMWVQDKLPNIFSPAAGAAQGPMDYCLGFGRLYLSQNYGYPARRHMEATVGVDETRFAPRPYDDAGYERFACDVSYVSHSSVPAEAILAKHVERAQSNDAKRMLAQVFERLRAVYDAGGVVTHRLHFERLLDATLKDLGAAMTPEQRDGVLDLFSHQINNAFFRHQSLHWLADMGVDLHLYGKGWESHPRFKRFAKGVANNERQLTTIFQTSRINLQVTPHGAIHQRLFEGLASGGFFLIRHAPGELVEGIYKPIWDWCQQQQISTDEELLARATPPVQAGLAELKQLLGFGAFEFGSQFMDVMKLSADTGFTRSAASIWPEYGEVAFDSKLRLQQKVTQYLADDQGRRRIAESMRTQVLERFTYLSTSRRLLDFIATELRERG
ncbi:MAG: hypothetical protein JWN40_838 [Phycisphaerales bacterium]|nr:hypothetical protein [Phycisphaerales bacterium]